MNDRLEDFVRANRESFDTLEPDPSIWLRINPENSGLRQKRRITWLRYAAAVAVIFAGFTAGTYYLKTGGHQQKNFGSTLSEEGMETEAYYSNLVNEKQKELEIYLANDRETKEMLKSDMNELDSIYADLKNDLNDDVSNPEVIEAMIQNYRIKLEILEDLLSQLKDMENQDYEKEDSYSL